MIIRFDDIQGVSFSEEDHMKLMRAFKNALVSFGEAKHVIWIHYKTIRYLESSGELGSYEMRVLEELKEVENEYKNFHACIGLCVNVDYLDKYKNEYDPQLGAICVGYGRLVDSRRWDYASLLVENFTDLQFFKRAAKTHLASERLLDSFSTDFRFENGGGGGVYDQFERLKESLCFFVCVVDSDKFHPNAPYGETAKKLVDKKGRVGNRQLIILDSSEVENIIPVEIIKQAVSERCNDRLEEFESLVEQGWRKYFDHKKGVRIEYARHLDDRYGHYWSAHPSVTSSDPPEWICRGLSDSIADHCLTLVEGVSVPRLTKMLKEGFDEEWMRIGEVLTSWGICRKKIIN